MRDALVEVSEFLFTSILNLDFLVFFLREQLERHLICRHTFIKCKYSFTWLGNLTQTRDQSLEVTQSTVKLDGKDLFRVRLQSHG